MTFEHIFALINAGFTADEIRAMQTTPAPAPEPAPAPTPAPEPAPAPTPAPEPAPAPDVLNMMSQLSQSVAKLTAQVQSMAIQQSAQPPAKNNAEEACNALASIVIPKI